jgi:hypothetical protein
MLLSDVSVAHCCADAYVAKASTTAGSAAEERARKKIRKYDLQEPGGYDCAPLVVKCHGRLCAASHVLLNKLGGLASDTGHVTKGAWIEGSLRQLSVALCKGNGFVFRSSLHSFCCAAGKHPKPGATVPDSIEE